MKVAILVAVVAALPPTVAAVLTYLQARSAQRQAADDRAVNVARSLEAIGANVAKIEQTVGRVEECVVDVRERVARLEGMVTPAGGGMRA